LDPIVVVAQGIPIWEPGKQNTLGKRGERKKKTYSDRLVHKRGGKSLSLWQADYNRLGKEDRGGDVGGKKEKLDRVRYT